MARPTVPITVSACADLGPRARRFEFSGMSLARSTLPGAYMSLWFADPDRVADSPRLGRSPKRTFTARWLDPEAETMTVDFVLHGSGPASTWAAGAGVGDTIWSGETKAGYAIAPDAEHVVLVGDDTAIPAMGAIADAAPEDVRITVVAEVVDRADERPISEHRDLDPIWLHRGGDPGAAGMPTINLLESLGVPEGAYWWVAGERDVIRTMRDMILGDRGVPRERFSLNAHWRLTATDPRRR